jgi:hypothetical protein
MENYNTILIFDYGQTQLITDTENKLVDSNNLPSLNAVIQDIYSKKPTDNESKEDYIRIVIYNNNFADWVNNNPGDYFKLLYSELDSNLINELVNEIKSNN